MDLTCNRLEHELSVIYFLNAEKLSVETVWEDLRSHVSTERADIHAHTANPVKGLPFA